MVASHTVVIDLNRGPMVIIDLMKVSRKPERITGISGPPDNEFACLARATSGSYLGGHWVDAPK